MSSDKNLHPHSQSPGRVISPNSPPAPVQSINPDQLPATPLPLQPLITLTEPVKTNHGRKQAYIAAAAVCLVLVGSLGITYAMRTKHTIVIKPAVKTNVNSVSNPVINSTAANTAPNPTRSSTPTSNTTTSSAPASSPTNTATLTPTDVATTFIKAIQSDGKATADSLESARFKAALKQSAQDESYYNVCKSDQFCAGFKWLDLNQATETLTDDKLPDGTAVKSVTFTVTSVVSGATSKNSVTISLSPTGSTWIIEDVYQSFEGSSN